METVEEHTKKGEFIAGVKATMRMINLKWSA